MEDKIVKIHQEVFDLLHSYHKKNPNEFFFSLRKINRKGRLDKGYWFLGDHNYLSISFWKGKDWMSKLPRISFVIDIDGLTSLQLSCKDTDEDIFDVKMLSLLGFDENEFDQGYRKNYLTFAKSDYMDSLTNFLKEDQQIIDKAIEGDYCVAPGEWMDYAEAVYFIPREKFNNNLKKTLEYQDARANLKKNTGYIESFSIKNYRSIKDVELTNLTLDNQWVFLTGENGSGKTSILRALAIGLCRNTDDFNEIEELENNCHIELNINWGIDIKTYNITKGTYKKTNKYIPNGFASYGPTRILTESTMSKDLVSLDLKTIFKRLTYGLFNSFDVLKDLRNPFDLGNEKPKYLIMNIDNFVENLSEILPGTQRVVYNFDEERLEFFEPRKKEEKKPKAKSFSELSSGTKSFAALIIDLLLKFRKAQPDIYDPGEYNGIVLIDEIDLHLHPKMQKEMVTQLSDTFPKIQFIVTTHSPISLLGAPDNSVFVKVTLDDNENIQLKRLYDIERNFKYLLPNALLTSDLFDLEDIVPINMEAENVSPFDTFDQFKMDQELNKQLDILKENDNETFNDLMGEE